ncbi:M3 family metallopeptidase [Synechococcus sp. HJ21-Hayes]|uniref:M3 family metallopeptidase n=1 Tax=unclassified Synechococcus TaxID=2626047 RepID=UPI0020CF6897|nr:MULTISPECIES: M3 family metallopeptidase [unclassified Synechococcus]MCP9830765.1 M3 family metallopeptidase [Synechococcus sp. JJ3a-Johnson]MCP9851935.1 M3 family metallopeptidase [Synechococcus sp. HJ21-Hayes]
MSGASSTASPIPVPAILLGEGLPPFEAITAEQVQAHIPALMGQLQDELSALEQQLEQALSNRTPLAWHQVMDPLQRMGERLRWSWGVVSHLNGVCNSPELREAHASQQAAVVQFGNRAGQSQVIYRALQQLQGQSRDLDATQERILVAELRDMQLRGVGLSGEAKEAFNAASQELAELSTRFGNQVLDATNSWTLSLTGPNDVDGLPTSLLDQLAQAARSAGAEGSTAAAGPWLLGLDMPRYAPFMKYSRRRDLREQLYKAHVGRASGQGEGSAADLNNWPLIEQILSLRGQQAQRLGYANWAAVSLAAKMADSQAAVEQLLEELRRAAHPVAQQELEALRACAARHGAPEASDLKPWDVSYWAEVLRQESFELDSEALRPYFPLPRVLEGLFSLCGRLFDIRIEAADGEAPVWHPDVRFFRVLEGAGAGARTGKAIAAFYLDPYSRPDSKRGGAWMDECLVRSVQADGTPVLPVAYLICNQSPPVGETPSLMTFEEVETLFHEFGHGLQHMLTTVERPQVAGINGVEWDAVELPSQFMENWCYDRATLLGMARHWQTGAALPEEEFAKLKAARTFMGGAATLRQVHFALTDMRLHSQWHPGCGQTPEQLRRQIAASTTVLPPIDEDAFLCSFGHIFSGGYAAGYYSYKWAEVLSADAFEAFEAVGLENETQIQETGRRFRDTVLSLGGSLDPKAVFEAFRGRQPSSEALIRHSGLVTV